MTRLRSLRALAAACCLVASLATISARAATGPAGTTPPQAPLQSYTAAGPVRILDARLAPNSTVTLAVPGAHGSVKVPATAGAGVLNLTVVSPWAAGHVTVFPAGSSRPGTSSLSWGTGDSRSNLVTSRLGSKGAVSIYNAAGFIHLLADLQGYYAPASLGSGAGHFSPLAPARIYTGSISRGATVTVQVGGRGGVPAAGAGVVVLNATVSSSAAGGLIFFPAGGSRPGPASLTWPGGQTTAGRVIVPLGSSGRVSVYSRSGPTTLKLDVNGWYSSASAASTAGNLFVPVSPQRVVSTTLGAGSTVSVPLAGVGGIARTSSATPPSAVALNVTATQTGVVSGLAAYPGGSRPGASDLAWNAGRTVANLVVVKLSRQGVLSLYNRSGQVHVLVDVEGFFSTARATAPFRIALSSTAMSLVADASNTAAVRALVRGANGRPVVGDVVSFDAGCGDVEPSQVRTDAGGAAVTTYSACPTAGPDSVTATDPGRRRAGLRLLLVPGPPAIFLSTLAGPATYSADQAVEGCAAPACTPVVLAFDVQDQNGNAVNAGVKVTFTTSLPNATLVPAVAVTDSAGVATSTLRAPKTGTGTVTAAVGDSSGSSPSLTIEPGALAQYVFTGQPAAGVAGSAQSATVSAEDRWGNVLTGLGSSTSPKRVQVTVGGLHGSPSGALPTLPSSLSFVGGAAGLLFTPTAAGTGFRLTVTDGDEVGGQSAAFQVQAGTPAQVALSSSSAGYGTGGTYTPPRAGAQLIVSATLEDRFGNPYTANANPAPASSNAEAESLLVELRPGPQADGGTLSGGGLTTPGDSSTAGGPVAVVITLSGGIGTFTYTAPATSPSHGAGTITFTDLGPASGLLFTPSRITITD